jgi:hypothetical protein
MKLPLFDLIAFRKFVSPGECTEVRIPKVFNKSPAWGNEFARGTVSGYFDNHEAFCQAVKLADKANHDGIYFTLQVIDPRLIGRSFNRLKPTNLTTSDNNVIAYRWLPVDLDPVRPSGISASKTEILEAVKMKPKVIQWVKERYGFADPIQAFSGNGLHLLFRLPDLPATDENREFIKGALLEIADEFDTDLVTIDRTNFNPARIWKLYGTTAKKGDPVPEGQGREARPHRVAFIETLGANS